jgi:hypothetical protein
MARRMPAILLCMSVMTGLGLRLWLLCRRGHYLADGQALAEPSKVICASIDHINGGVVNAPNGTGNGVSRPGKSEVFSSKLASIMARRRVAIASAASALLLASGAALQAQIASGTNAVTSPNKRLQLQFSVLRDGLTGDGPGRLVYAVVFDGKPLIEDSGLTLSLAGARPLGDNIRIT